MHFEIRENKEWNIFVQFASPRAQKRDTYVEIVFQTMHEFNGIKFIPFIFRSWLSSVPKRTYKNLTGNWFSVARETRENDIFYVFLFVSNRNTIWCSLRGYTRQYSTIFNCKTIFWETLCTRIFKMYFHLFIFSL